MILQRTDSLSGPSFTLRNRVLRQIWNWTWLLLFRPSPRSAHRWRAALLRVFGAKLGRGVHIYPSVKVWAPWQLTMADNAAAADGVTLYNISPIEIGECSIVSQGAHLCTGSHDYNSPTFQLIAAPIVLGRHVWICAEAFVSPGVSLPDGAVLAPRSVVTKPLRESWTVYGGMPAKAIGQRKPQP
jgi:putative colanic acid biosynthesis acetyltransferase WcaF